MRHPMLRTLLMLWAVATAALPGTLAFAEAAAESSSAQRDGGHVEATSGRGCLPAHTDACEACRAMGALTAVLPPNRPSGAIAGADVRSPCRTALPHGSAGRVGTRPRAPPIA